MSDDNTATMGKKVFFLHPSAFVRNSIVEDLIQQEFEIYMVRDETKLQAVLKKYPDSIVFACLDEVLSPPQWEKWIRETEDNKVTKDVSIGILSNTLNDDVQKHFRESCRIPCGFITIKSDKKDVKTLLNALNAVGAKGRRKYVRTNTRGDTKVTLNIPVGDSYATGEIRDISMVGLSCAFPQETSLRKNTLLKDMQLKLHSTLIKAEGIVFGSREELAETIYVFLFTEKTDPSVRAKIRTFIQKNLQSKMDEEMK
jgi:hypothetical protein